jgi:hypothetical protein
LVTKLEKLRINWYGTYFERLLLSLVKGKDCINEETLGDYLSDQTVGMGHECICGTNERDKIGFVHLYSLHMNLMAWEA